MAKYPHWQQKTSDEVSTLVLEKESKPA